jgi:hypothetical protein
MAFGAFIAFNAFNVFNVFNLRIEHLIFSLKRVRINNRS